MRSNSQRWENPENFSHHWSSRSKLIASLIPEKSSVIEFGVGLFPIFEKGKASHILKYTQTDFVPRPNLTFLYDLNKIELDEFDPHDIAVFSGVLEYVHDLPSKIEFISSRVKSIITSYCTLEKYPTDRELRGWVNSYTSTEFIQIFKDSNFRLSSLEIWKNQTIYVFLKENS